MHTTASDGLSEPEALIAEAVAAGIEVLAVTDHDTLAGLARAGAAAREAGLGFVPGIEVTAVHDGRDVHMLGYYVDRPDASFTAFLEAQRRDRLRRVEAMGARLADLGAAIDVEAVLAGGSPPGRAIGRPALARALVAGGHVATVADAFDRYLGQGRPAFVPRTGVPPVEVLRQFERIGAIASLAHPGKQRQDDLIAELAAAGLPAIEVFHPDHTPEDVERYAQAARDLGLLRTGGSDYHGAASGRASGFGRVGVPAADLRALEARAGRQG